MRMAGSIGVFGHAEADKNDRGRGTAAPGREKRGPAQLSGPPDSRVPLNHVQESSLRGH